MHEKLKKAIGIDKANCSTCYWLGGEGECLSSYESYPICNHPDRRRKQVVVGFPFTSEQECWTPSFWHSEFAKQIETGEAKEFARLTRAFNDTIAEVKFGGWR